VVQKRNDKKTAKTRKTRKAKKTRTNKSNSMEAPLALMKLMAKMTAAGKCQCWNSSVAKLYWSKKSGTAKNNINLLGLNWKTRTY
jgi:hypothetical protein